MMYVSTLTGGTASRASRTTVASFAWISTLTLGARLATKSYVGCPHVSTKTGDNWCNIGISREYGRLAILHYQKHSPTKQTSLWTQQSSAGIR